MQVTINSQVVTNKRTQVVFSAEEMKNVALLTAKNTVGSTDTITGTSAEVGNDGSITVIIDETITTTSDDSAQSEVKADAKVSTDVVAEDADKAKVVVADAPIAPVAPAAPVVVAPATPAAPAAPVIPATPAAPAAPTGFSLRQG